MGYSRQDKIIAIGVIERHGGEVSQSAIDDIRQILNTPNLNKSTIYRWWQGREKIRPVASIVQPEKKEASQKPDVDKEKSRLQELQSLQIQDEVATANAVLSSRYLEVAKLYLDHAVKPEVIKKLSGSQAVVGAATATDKFRLIHNLPTEIIQVVTVLVDELKRQGYNPSDVFNEMLKELANADSE